MRKEVKNWLDSARYDLEVAGHLLGIGSYVYTVFMCQLALEKVMKAKVEEITGKAPPKTHDLRRLMRLAQLAPDDTTEDFVLEVSNLSVVTRYPEDFQTMLKDFSRERAEFTLSKAIEVFQWIEKTISS